MQAYGYGGVGLIINCLTDNTNRAKTEINNVIKRTDVKIASSGCVMSFTGLHGPVT
jgi:transcriptional/translational regulatory protein YebC/TACO1